MNSLTVENKKLFFLSATLTELGFITKELLLDWGFGEAFRRGVDSGDICRTGDLVDPSSRVDLSMVPFLDLMMMEPAEEKVPSREVFPFLTVLRRGSFSGGVGCRNVSRFLSSFLSLHCLWYSM